MVALLGATWMEVTFARTTVAVVVPVMLAELAVTVADPTDTPLSKPELALMVATDAGVLDQLKFETWVLTLPSS
jgi:hypothetical protein